MSSENLFDLTLEFNEVVEEVSFELELTESGDTLFLRDDAGGLVVWGDYQKQDS